MPMTLEKFSDLVDSHGPRLASWPSAVRSEAEELALASESAQALLAAALEIDALLRAPQPAIKAPVGLLDRICSAAAQGDTDDTDPNGSLSFQHGWADPTARDQRRVFNDDCLRSVALGDEHRQIRLAFYFVGAAATGLLWGMAAIGAKPF